MLAAVGCAICSVVVNPRPRPGSAGIVVRCGLGKRGVGSWDGDVGLVGVRPGVG